MRINPNDGRKTGKWKKIHSCEMGKTRWERSGAEDLCGYIMEDGRQGTQSMAWRPHRLYLVGSWEPM